MSTVCAGYLGYAGLYSGSGLAHAQLRSQLPPPKAAHWNTSANTSQARRALCPPAVPTNLEPPRLLERPTCASTLFDLASPQTLSERQCSQIEPCRLHYRAHSMLYVSRGGLCKVLRKHFALAGQSGSICFKERGTARANVSSPAAPLSTSTRATSRPVVSRLRYWYPGEAESHARGEGKLKGGAWDALMHQPRTCAHCRGAGAQ